MIPSIETGRVVPGAKRLSPEETGVSATFRGVIQTQKARHTGFIKILQPKELASELVLSTIGVATGLPMPKGFLLAARVCDFSGINLISHLSSTDTFPAFGCADLKHPNLTKKLRHDSSLLQKICDLRDTRQIQDVIILDEWVANIDRHPGNLLLGPGLKLELIDHGWCFTGPQWAIPDLDVSAQYANRFAARVLPLKDQLWKSTMLLYSKQSEDGYKALPIDEVVEKSRIKHVLPSSDVAAMKTFLKDRSSLVQTLISRRVGLPIQLKLVP